MPWEHIELDITDAIATVALNRPTALNSFIGSMREDLLDAFQVAAKCSRVIVLTGAGDAFCSGGDVHAMAGATADELKSFIQGVSGW
ncbi:MAG: enoyl-CoA hydratase/isomerase family protein [Vicinamibacteria bacterium]